MTDQDPHKDHPPESASSAAASSHASVDDAAEIALTAEEKEEMQEVIKMSQADTNRVKNWRLLALLALVITGLCVTIITYKLLKKEEKDNFETAVRYHALFVYYMRVIERNMPFIRPQYLESRWSLLQTDRL